MKKLLILLTLGLMFGQTEVSQRVANYDGNQGGVSYLEILFPDYNLDWAIINIVDCGDENECYIQALNGNSTEHHQWYDNDGFHYYPAGASKVSTFFADGNNGFILSGFGSSGKILVTAEFPIEDTGYMEEDFDFCINEGMNLVSYPCENDIAINDALPSEISNNLSSIVGEGVAGVNNNGTWVGSLTQLQSGSGYWFNSSIEACFNYECAEN